MKNLIKEILVKNGMTFDELKKIGHIKIKKEGFMDLNIDYLGKITDYDHYAVVHNYIQNFDVMADPNIQFIDRQNDLI